MFLLLFLIVYEDKMYYKELMKILVWIWLSGCVIFFFLSFKELSKDLSKLRVLNFCMGSMLFTKDFFFESLFLIFLVMLFCIMFVWMEFFGLYFLGVFMLKEIFEVDFGFNGMSDFLFFFFFVLYLLMVTFLVYFMYEFVNLFFVIVFFFGISVLMYMFLMMW